MPLIVGQDKPAEIMDKFPARVTAQAGAPQGCRAYRGPSGAQRRQGPPQGCRAGRDFPSGAGQAGTSPVEQGRQGLPYRVQSRQGHPQGWTGRAFPGLQGRPGPQGSRQAGGPPRIQGSRDLPRYAGREGTSPGVLVRQGPPQGCRKGSDLLIFGNRVDRYLPRGAVQGRQRPSQGCKVGRGLPGCRAGWNLPKVTGQERTSPWVQSR